MYAFWLWITIMCILFSTRKVKKANYALILIFTRLAYIKIKGWCLLFFLEGCKFQSKKK